MFRNYFKTAWRNIIRSKGYSTLNILGLATGMAVALLIGLWVYKEYSYDKFLPHADRLYQVRRNFDSNGEILNFTSTSLKLADALRREVPELEYVAEAQGPGPQGLKAGEKKIFEQGMTVQGDFLKMFGYPLLQGSAQTVFSDPYSIVITEQVAKALFGSSDAMNQTVRLNNNGDLKVTGVLKDLPSNSSFQFGFLVPFTYLESNYDWVKRARNAGYGWNSFQIYVQVKPRVLYSQLADKIKNIEHTDKDNINAMKSQVVFQPLLNWHLYGNYVNGKETGGFLEYVNMFSVIGLLVLLIACVNFVNLTTARSEKRAREVGVRKAIGSMKKDLIFQFLTESVLLTFFAFLFSLLLVLLLLPSFNLLTHSRLSIPFLNPVFWSTMIGCVLITAILAGSRPAFFLSAFNPVQVLKGTLHTGKTQSLPRKILVVLQFTCSITLIISTMVIYQQIQYARNRPTGLNMNRLMMTNMNSDLGHNYTAFRNELKIKGIAGEVTTASSPATDIYWHSDVDKWPGKNAGETIEMGTIQISASYFKTLGMEMKEGRDFIGDADTTNVIFNESAIRLMRIKNPLSREITFHDNHVHIIGVVKDALVLSPFASADPTIFVYRPDPQNVMMYRLSPGIKTTDAISQLTALFNKYAPAYPFSYQFADASYASKFDLELLLGKLSGLFAGLAIFISCLGLFGLAAFMAEQRTKEIGIRKVLGASVSQLWLLLSKDFIVLVLLSCMIATPFAIYFLHGWLQKYNYRISLGAGVFIMAAGMALVITLVTISFQAIRTAFSNPVKSLRTE